MAHPAPAAAPLLLTCTLLLLACPGCLSIPGLDARKLGRNLMSTSPSYGGPSRSYPPSYQPVYGPPSPPPYGPSGSYSLPPPYYGGVGYGGVGLPVELRPDVAHFDASALATVSISPAYGTVSQLWDQRTAPQGDRTDDSLPYQVLNFRGNCQYDGSAEGGGGSVLFDGSSCHAEMNLRLCDWETMAGDEGFTMVVVSRRESDGEDSVEVDPESAAEDAIKYGRAFLSVRHMRATDFEANFFDGQYIWKPNVLFHRWVTGVEQWGYANEPYSWPQYEDHDAKLSFPKTPADTWQIDVVSYDARREVVKYYRGGEGPGLASTLLVQKERLVGPDGRELVLGCDYIEDLGAAAPQQGYFELEPGCKPSSFFRGRISALLAYGRELRGSEVAALHAHYRARWQQGARPPAPPPSPPLPPAPPAPPGTGLPSTLLPDLAYFDASTASSGPLVDSPDGSSVAGLRDVLRPTAQRLAWQGDCRYDAAAGGGAVALDGGSCHAMLDTRLCGEWDIKLNSKYVNSFSLVVVYRLDDTYPAPPPRPPAPPAENTDGEIGDLDLSGSGLITYSRMVGPYSYFMDIDYMWTTASLYSAAPYTDYESFDSRDNFSQRAPRGKWIVEVLAGSYDADWESGANRVDVWRGVEGEQGVTRVLESPYTAYPPDGYIFSVGCTWQQQYDRCKPRTHLRGHIAAVMAYSRALGAEEAQRLFEAYSQRWSSSGAGSASSN